MIRFNRSLIIAAAAGALLIVASSAGALPEQPETIF